MNFKGCLMHFNRCWHFQFLLVMALLFSVSELTAGLSAEQKKVQGTEKKDKSKAAEKKPGKKKSKKIAPKKESVKKATSTIKSKEDPVPAETKGGGNNEEFNHLPLLEMKKSESNRVGTTDQTGRTVFEGPYGSRYVLNKNGKKLYLRQNK